MVNCVARCDTYTLTFKSLFIVELVFLTKYLFFTFKIENKLMIIPPNSIFFNEEIGKKSY